MPLKIICLIFNIFFIIGCKGVPQKPEINICSVDRVHEVLYCFKLPRKAGSDPVFIGEFPLDDSIDKHYLISPEDLTKMKNYENEMSRWMKRHCK